MSVSVEETPATMDLAHVHEILKERARALAKAPEPESDEAQLEFVRVTIAGESYGLETSFVDEVLGAGDLSFLPCTPEWVKGILARRGEILSVIDLRPLLGLPVNGGGAHVVVVAGGRMVFGLLVDSVVGVETIPAGTLQDKVEVLSGQKAEYLKGVTQERVAILELSRILNDRTLVVDETP